MPRDVWNAHCLREKFEPVPIVPRPGTARVQANHDGLQERAAVRAAHGGHARGRPAGRSKSLVLRSEPTIASRRHREYTDPVAVLVLAVDGG